MTKDKDTNVSLSEVYRRLEFLERRTESPGALVTNIVNNSEFNEYINTLVQNFTGRGGNSGSWCVPATGIGTSTARRWAQAFGQAVATTIASANCWPVPPHITRLTSMSLVILVGGSGGAGVDYTATLGSTSAETDTPLVVSTASNFTGVASAAVNVPVTTDRVLRLAITKPSTLTGAPASIFAFVNME